MKAIHGKRAMVTGAASGIGRAIALALARAGADLCLLDIDEHGLANVALQVRSLGVRVMTVTCDPSTRRPLEGLPTSCSRRGEVWRS